MRMLIKKYISINKLHIIDENFDIDFIFILNKGVIIQRLASFKKTVWLTNYSLEVPYILIYTNLTI